MAEFKCPIWGTAAETIPTQGDYEEFDSPEAGGRYRITRTALNSISALNDRQRAALTAWLESQRHTGINIPTVDSKIVEDSKVATEPSVVARRDAALRWIASNSPRLGHKLKISGEVDASMRSNHLALKLATQSVDDREWSAILRYLEADDLIERRGDNIIVTFNGWQRVELGQFELKDRVQAFIAMWFESSLADAYEKGIAAAVRDCGFEPLRIDKKEHANKVDDEIIAEIRKSRFLVADFTSARDKPRGGVYFEAGFAMGLGIPVIWCCEESLIDQVHFDTRQFNHVAWRSPENLREKLAKRIGAVIGFGPLRPKS